MSEGSLLRLFTYEGFTLEMLLEYLQKRTEPGIISYLINKLYEYPAIDIQFYLPQILSHYFRTPESCELERLLLQISINSHTFAVALHFNLVAYLGDCDPSYKPKGESFLETLEMAIVNAAHPKATSSKPPPHLFDLPEDDTEIEGFNRKTIRLEYFHYQLKTINLLCKISVGLSQISTDQRDVKLKYWLKSLNETIKETRKHYLIAAESIRKLFRGPVINFNFHYDSDKGVQQVVKVLFDKSLCFSTKARVPYKVLFECIDLLEDDYSAEASSANTIEEEVIEYLNSVDVEGINKLVHNSERYEGLNQFAVEAEKNEGSDIQAHNNNVPVEEEPVENIWGEPWEEFAAKIRETSPFCKYESWKLRGLIVKGLDDLRQEYLAMQFIQKVNKIWQDAHLSLYLRPYEIKIVSNYMGFIEYIPNTLSLHSIRKSLPAYSTLLSFFKQNWSNDFEEAQRNFVQSMAGYSLVCYLLNIKDRHNGNILLDSLGHIIHIDFGFFLTISPGGNIGFESAPFKLTAEMIEVMSNGDDQAMYRYFKILLLQGFLELRKHADSLLLLVEMMGVENNLMCLEDFERAISELRERFQLSLTDEKCMNYVEQLVLRAGNNWRTMKYDDFQYLTNGIL